MQRTIFVPLAAVAFLLLASATCDAQFVFEELSDSHLRSILRGMGQDDIDTLNSDEESTSMRIVLYDWNVVLMNYHQSGDLRIFAIFDNDEGETERTLSLANEWNRDQRFAKVLIDEDGDWIIESDFDIRPGVTEEQLEAWIDLWAAVLRDFVDFINEDE